MASNAQDMTLSRTVTKDNCLAVTDNAEISDSPKQPSSQASKKTSAKACLYQASVQDVLYFLKSGRQPPPDFQTLDKDTRKKRLHTLAQFSRNFVYEEGTLFYQPQGKRKTDGQPTKKAKVLFTRGEIEHVLAELHSQGKAGSHVGEKRTQASISERFYWRSITEDVRQWIAACSVCQRTNTLVPVQRASTVVPVPDHTYRACWPDRCTMEVCVDSVESAINAEKGGASRLELCGNLMEGGTTPSLGMLKVVKQRVGIPVYVMIRPRGGDFLYSPTEQEVMKADLLLAKEQGADGIVLGALTEDGRIDMDFCRQLIDLARPLSVTFHRAFDMVEDPSQALEDVISLGCDRLLTSGCDSTVLEGLPTLKKLTKKAKGRIIVVPGGGINERNLQRVLQGTGVREFHCSASSFQPSSMVYRNTAVFMGGALRPPEFGYKVASIDRVRTLGQIAQSTVR